MIKCLFILLLLPFILTAQVPEITNSTVVGGVTENSARIWVRLSASGNINVELSEDEFFTEKIKGEQAKSSVSTNLAAIINVSGLKPATRYFYRILFDDKVITDKIRSFKTFPLKGSAVNFSFGFGSCQQSGTFLPSDTKAGNVYREIIKHDLDLFLQIGDWTYPDTTEQLPGNNDYYSSDYRRVQKNYESKYNKSYPMDTLLSTTPVDYVYDDHDFMNNNSSAATSSFAVADKPNPYGNDFVLEEITAPAGTRENSIRGYKENFPSYDLANESRGIYHKFTFGSAEFFMLDLRSQRSPNLNSIVKNNSSGKWEFSPSNGHTILGREDSPGNAESQLTWFLNSLKNSKSKWKFLVSSVAFNKSQRAIIDASITLQDVNFSIPGVPFGVKGIAAAMEVVDKWAGFPEDIDTLLSFIEKNKIKNVIVLSGDTHTSAMDDGANAGLPELMSANLDITNSRTVKVLDSIGIHIWNKGGQGLTTNEFYNAFGKVIIYGNDSINLALIDEFGKKFASYTLKDQEVSSIIAEENIPGDYYALYNYPNPFNPSTNIEFIIGQDAYVSIKIYDLLGREVQTLISGKKNRGTHNIIFDASGLPSGVYLCNMFVRDNEGRQIRYFQTKKFVLLK